MSVLGTCPRCGARRAADAPGGLCPDCLQRAAIEPGEGAGERNRDEHPSAERIPTLDTGWRLSHYEIVGRLGAGGMGEVYRALDQRLGREVAIKVLPSDLARREDRRRRFEREARAVAALNHPNIVTVHSVEEAIPEGPSAGEIRPDEDRGSETSRERPDPAPPAETVHFLTMELVEGDDLSELIGEVGLPLDRFFELAVPLAGAVGAAHERGIVHRDLKPGNVMVSGSGGRDGELSLKVLDFGLAKLRWADPEAETEVGAPLVTRLGTVVGTAPYMSPEQAEGRAIDERSDVFALGIVLYEMLTGSRPFDGDSGLAVRAAIVGHEPPPPSALRPDVTPVLDRIVARCLHKDPDLRYRSAAELARDLRTCRAAAPAVSARGERAAWRRPIVVAGAIALVVLLAAVGVGYWRLGREARVAEGGSAERAGEGEAGPVASSAGPRYSSIAVLPLTNVSGDPGQEWFASGMTETLITELSRIRTLKVISRTSSMHYKGSDKPLRQIASELGVDAVVEGSALWIGERVRITAQLIDAASDHHLWADDYDRELSDALALHRDVAREIATQVRATLGPAERDRLETRPSADPQATVAYLRGLDHLHALDTRAAVEEARRAIALDPAFARGHDLLAEALHMNWEFARTRYGESVPEARAAARRALELEPDLASSRALIGWSLMTVDHDWDAAAEHLRAAYELDPSTGWSYAYWLQARGRFGEAIEAGLQTVERDPANPLAMCDLAQVCMIARRYEEAGRWITSALAIDPAYGYAHYLLPEALLGDGLEREALQAFVEGIRQSWPAAGRQDHRLYAEASRRGGWPAVWRLLLERIDGYALTPRQEIRLRIRAHLGLGETAEALAQIELLEELRDPWLIVLRSARFDPLRDEPRFREMLQRLGYPQET